MGSILKRNSIAGLKQRVRSITLPTTVGAETQLTAEVLPDGSVGQDEVWAATVTGLPVVGAAVVGTTITPAGALWIELKFIPAPASGGWTPVIKLSRLS